jgi:nucleoid DNA-binding protein
MLWREPSPEVVDGKGDDGIKAGVKKSKNVQLVGFGTFKVASRGPAPE